MKTGWSRAIVLTPRAGGTDGVSAVTRLYAGALAAQIGSGVDELDIWSLDETERPPRMLDARVTFRGAAGSRLRFAGFGLRGGRVDDRTLAIVQHVHLLPVALPLAWRGARVLLLLHGVEAWKPLRPLERAACGAAWKIAAVSEHTAARFRAANPESSSTPIEICPPGLPSTPAGAGSGVAGPYALIVGRMASDERYKGHDQLLEAWSAVRDAVPAAQLVVVGGGDDSARLRAKTERLGLEDAVRFEGIVDDSRLAALYRDAAVFVMPSPNEGFGLVYVEAMSAGIPCIVASGAAEEIVEDGATGTVVPPGDTTALQRAIIRFMTHPAERARMGAAAAETARQRFSPAAFAVRLYDLLQLPQVPAAC